MSDKPTIAITGASGFLGSYLVDYFVKKGWNVIGLVRHPTKQPIHRHITYRTYDIGRAVSSNTLKGVDYLVHAAYVKQTSEQPNAFEVNVSGAKQILGVARANKVKRTVFISTMSAHEGATSVYGQQKMAIEHLFSMPTDTSIRSGLILGNGGIVKDMASFIRSKHVVPLVGGGMQPLQVIYVGDLATAIERILLSSQIHGVLTIAYEKVYRYRDFYTALAKRIGIRFMFVPLPYALLLTVIKILRVIGLKPGINEENVHGLKNLRSADTKQSNKAVGIKPRNLEDSLAAVDFDAA